MLTYEESTNAPRFAAYRVVFTLAAAYNVALGVYLVAFPNAFFDTVGIARPNYPGLWRCLGMVLGVYGLLYARVAQQAERLSQGKPIVAIGLLGKLLGPIGWLSTVASGEWPVRTVTLLFLDDLVWWVPFTLYLLEGTRILARLRPLAPIVCAATNAVGVAWFAAFVRPATEIEPDVATRAAYIASHEAVFRAAWFLWLAAATALLAFFAWWGARSPRPRLALAGFAVAAVGILFDATGDSLFVGWLPDRMDLSRTADLLSGGVANGLYSLGGVLLTFAHPTMPRRLRLVGFAAWGAGLLLTAAVVLRSVPAIVAATGLTFLLFVPWVVVAGRWMRASAERRP